MMRDDTKWCTVGWFCWCRSCQLWNWNSGSEAGSGVPSSPSGTNQSATTISLLFSHPPAGLPWSLSPASTAMVSSIWYCDLLHSTIFWFQECHLWNFKIRELYNIQKNSNFFSVKPSLNSLSTQDYFTLFLQPTARDLCKAWNIVVECAKEAVYTRKHAQRVTRRVSEV